MRAYSFCTITTQVTSVVYNNLVLDYLRVCGLFQLRYVVRLYMVTQVHTSEPDTYQAAMTSWSWLLQQLAHRYNLPTWEMKRVTWGNNDPELTRPARKGEVLAMVLQGPWQEYGSKQRSRVVGKGTVTPQGFTMYLLYYVPNNLYYLCGLDSTMYLTTRTTLDLSTSIYTSTPNELISMGVGQTDASSGFHPSCSMSYNKCEQNNNKRVMVWPYDSPGLRKSVSTACVSSESLTDFHLSGYNLGIVYRVISGLGTTQILYGTCWIQSMSLCDVYVYIREGV